MNENDAQQVADDTVVDSEGTERHAVDGEGRVLARSSDSRTNVKLTDEQKADAPQVPESSHLEPAPKRHAHTAHEPEVVGATIADADFDAEESREEETSA